MYKTSMFVTLLLFFVLGSGLFAQTRTIDFETGETGTAWNWVVTENGSNPAMTFPANPASDAVNGSANVAEFTALDAGANWALCFTDDIDDFKFNANNSTVSIMVYKPVISNIAIKFEGSSPAVEIQIPNTVVNQWENIVFDFSGSIGNTYSRLVIIPDFANRDQDNVIYFDNIVMPSGNVFTPEPNVPEVAAPVPTVDAEDVISIYSDSYTDLEGTNFAAPWGQSTVVSFDDIEGNNMMKYATFNFQGTQLLGAHNLTAMTHVHIDMWTDDATVVKFSPISALNGEHLVSLEPINAETWNSYDIPLEDFTGLRWDDIHQLKFDGQAGVYPSTIYLDNIYFYASDAASDDATLSDLRVDDTTVDGFASNVYSYNVDLPEGTEIVPTVTATTNHTGASYQINNATELPGTTSVVVTAEDTTTSLTYIINFTVGSSVPTQPTAAAPTPTHLHENVKSVFSNVYGDMAGANFNPSWGQTTLVLFELIEGDTVIKYQNFNYQGTEFPATSIESMEYVHIDMWTPDATVVMFSPISGSRIEHLVSLTPLVQGTWNSYDIPLTDFSDIDLSDVYQLKFTAEPGFNPCNVWIDNVFFWKNPIGAGADATLSNLMVNGTTVTGFSSGVYTYNVELPYGTTEVPVVTATTTDPLASHLVTNATGLPGTATVAVTSANEEEHLNYTINFTVGDEVAEPTVGAPIPDEPAQDVISIFSNTYGDMAGTNFNPYWGQQTVVTFEGIDGNTTLKYDNFNYQGTQLAGSIDLSLMEYVHVDLWTANAEQVQFSPISISTGEVLTYFSPLEQETWNSFDIPLEDFTNLSMSDIHQLKFVGTTGSTVYLDNIYFWKNPTQAGSDATLSDLKVNGTTVTGFAPSTLTYSVELPYGTTEVPAVTATTTDPLADYVVNDAAELPGTTTVVVTAQDETTILTYSVVFTIENPVPSTGAPNPTYAPADVTSIFSNVYGDIAGANFNPNWGQQTTVTFENIDGNTTLKYSNFNYQGTEFPTTDMTARDYVHIDIWTPNATVVKFSPITTSGELLLELDPLVPMTWNSVDIPLSDFAGLNMAEVYQLKFDCTAGVWPSTVFLDNIFFYTAETTLAAPQNVAITFNGDQVTVTWDPVDGANGYKIYASDSPNGTFEEVTMGVFYPTSWTGIIEEGRKFFYVKANDNVVRSNN